MTIYSFTETRRAAIEKWREYKAAEKVSGNPLYKDLRIIYNQMKAGRKIVDISKVIAAGGVHDNFHPKLAIAIATTKKITCRYYQNGTVKYMNDRSRDRVSGLLRRLTKTHFVLVAGWDLTEVEKSVMAGRMY